jgi:hypothetical protein
MLRTRADEAQDRRHSVSERPVYKTGKDADGTITSLCAPGESWSPRQKDDAVRDIESKQHRYYVPLTDGRKVDVEVVAGPRGKYLRTNWDGTKRNNLDNLPDC